MTSFLDFFVSSEAIPSSSIFLGYGFQDTDLVIGAEGYAEFIASGKSPLDDCDGCYLQVLPDGDGNVLFSTDFRGYFPLFYYRFGEDWIVSPSFEVVAKEASARGLPLTFRRHQFVSWRSASAMHLSPSSARSPFDEVCLLSYDEYLVAGRQGLNVRKKKRTLKSASYDEALSNMIATWGGRIMTILNGNMAIRVDLSGGVDSRTVLAVLYWTLQKNGRLDLLNSESIFINSSSKMLDDYKVATEISNELKITLNNPRRRQYIKVSDEESLATWRRYNIARYSPHILPPTSQKSNIITFSGVGGEDHRAFYDGFGRGNFGEYLVNFMPLFSDMASFGRWMGDLHDDVDLPSSVYDSAIPASIRHYRRHRSRHHTAKQPASELMGIILGSRYSYECASFLDVESFEDNQLLFDVMINCNRHLASMPYDLPHKAPKQKNFDNFTCVNMIAPASTGKIWRHMPDSPTQDEPIKRPNILLKNMIQNVLSRQEIRELITEEVSLMAEAQLSKLTWDNNLHVNGHLFHYVMLADVVLRYRTSI